MHVESPPQEECDGIVSGTLQKSTSLGDLLQSQKDEALVTPPITDEQSFKSKVNRFFNRFRREKEEFKVQHVENKVFGNLLDHLDMDKDHPNVPLFVTTCIQLIDKEDAITTLGIYRASGNKTVIDEVRKKVSPDILT